MKNFAMFTEAGNSAVAKIVECAETAELCWTTVEAMLVTLSQDMRYAEAFDTEVRERAYKVLFAWSVKFNSCFGRL